MADTISLSKYEKQVLPKFRDQLNQAESEEDVKKFFVETVERLLALATKDGVDPQYNDIRLVPGSPPYYQLNPDLLNSQSMKALANSDLQPILHRIAQPAANRYRHVAKHPEKTNSKIKGH